MKETRLIQRIFQTSILAVFCLLIIMLIPQTVSAADDNIFDSDEGNTVFIYRVNDNTDPDNIVEMEDYTVIKSTNVNGNALRAYRMTFLDELSIEGYAIDQSATARGVNSPYIGVINGKVTWIYDYYVFKNEGDYTLTYKTLTDDEGNAARYYIFGLLDDEDSYLFYNALMTLNDEPVWCIEPNVPTNAGVKYTAQTGEENVLATLATIYGYGYKGDTSAIAAMTTQCVIWNSVGAGSVDDELTIYKSYSDQLSEEEYQKVRDIKTRIKRAYELYQGSETLGLTTEQNGVSINGDNISVDGDASTIVLNVANAELMSYYKYGQISYPDGITGEVSDDNTMITLNIDKAVYNGGTVKFSMIPEEFQRESTLYTASSAKQKLMKFGILNPNEEEIKPAIAKDEKTNDDESDEISDVG